MNPLLNVPYCYTDLNDPNKTVYTVMFTDTNICPPDPLPGMNVPFIYAGLNATGNNIISVIVFSPNNLQHAPGAYPVTEGNNIAYNVEATTAINGLGFAVSEFDLSQSAIDSISAVIVGFIDLNNQKIKSRPHVFYPQYGHGVSLIVMRLFDIAAQNFQHTFHGEIKKLFK